MGGQLMDGAGEGSLLSSRTLVVRIRLKLGSHDLHGFHALWLWRDHVLVRSLGYFYVLDSVTVQPYFSEVFDDYSRLLADRSARDIIYTVPCPNSNIAVFGWQVVERYRDVFGHPLDKKE